MPVPIQWSQHELALLFGTYMRIEAGEDRDKLAFELSMLLQKLAKESGVDYEDALHNAPRVKLKIANLRYLFTKGKRGLPGASEGMRELFKLYTDYPAQYRQIMHDAYQLAGQTMPDEEAIGADKEVPAVARQAAPDAKPISTVDGEKKPDKFLLEIQAAIKENQAISIGAFIDCDTKENVPIAQLQLSKRAENCLNRELKPCATVQAILNMPLIRLVNARNAGAKTIQEILSALRDFANPVPIQEASPLFKASGRRFAYLMQYSELVENEEWDKIEEELHSDKELSALLEIMDMADAIGPQFVAAILRSAYPTRVLLPALLAFQEEAEKEAARRQSIQEQIALLPPGRAELPVLPFVNAWSFVSKGKIPRDSINDCTGFAEIADIACQMDDDDYSMISYFLAWCKQDIKSEIERIVSLCIKGKRQASVIKLRSMGKSLSEVGEQCGLSRERVRQIERKGLRALKVYDAFSVMALISSVREGSGILTEADIIEYGEQARLFFYMLQLAGDSAYYNYIKPLNIFVPKSAYFDDGKVRDFVDGLPDTIEESALPGILQNAAQHGLHSDLVELQIHTDFSYIESIHTWQRGTISIRKMCREVLSLYGLMGIRISSTEELQDFRRRFADRFGSEARISETDHALVSIIRAVGMLRDRGTYIAKREHILSDRLLSAIISYINQSSADACMYSEIFDAFKDRLMKEGVDNRYFLQGILHHEWEGLFIFAKDSMSKDARSAVSKKLARQYQNLVIDDGDTEQDGLLPRVEKKETVLDAVITVLQGATKPMTLREITNEIQEKEIFCIQGANPMAAVYTALKNAVLGKGYRNTVLGRHIVISRDDAGRHIYSLRDSSAPIYIASPDTPVRRLPDKGALSPCVKRKDTLLDAAITVLQGATKPLTLQEITDEIQQKKLFNIRSSNPRVVVYIVLDSALKGKGVRNAMLGRHILASIDDDGRNIYSLRKSSVPIYGAAQATPARPQAVEEVAPVSPTLAERWNNIIAEAFEDGLRLNGMRIRKFRGIYEKRYHEALEADDERLIKQLKATCTFRDDRIYPKQSKQQNALIKRISNEINKLLLAGASGVYPQQLFERYQQPLAQQLSVYTLESLTSLLMDVPEKAYGMSYGIFCLPGKACKPELDVEALFKASYQSMNYAQICEQLWYIPLNRLKQKLAEMPAIVNVEQETYFYAPNFPIGTHELTALQHAMHRRIEDDGFIVAKQLRALMQEHCPSAMMDTAAWKGWGIRNVMTYLLRDHFEFNGIVISEKGSGMDTKEVFRSYCRSHKRVTIDELKELCAQLDVSGIYWDSVMAEMVRISRTELVSKSMLHFDVRATDRALDIACPGEYMALKDFALFMTLPSVEFPWNGYLLESYLKCYSQLFTLNQAGQTEGTYIGAMVRRSSSIKTHYDLMVAVLSSDDSWNDEREAFALLREGGYRAFGGTPNASELLKTAQEKRKKRQELERWGW